MISTLLLLLVLGSHLCPSAPVLGQSRAVRRVIAWGMLIAVTESEDLSRLDPDDIAPACADTFLGTTRIDEQMAIAAFWPSDEVAEDFGEPASVDVPVLLWSGTHDPSTTPAWGAEAARHLPSSLHLVIPSGRGVFGPEVRRVDRALLQRGSVEGLNRTEIEALTLPPLEELDPAVKSQALTSRAGRGRR